MLAFTIVYKVTGNFELARDLWELFYNEFLYPICTDTEGYLELYYIDVQVWLIEHMGKMHSAIIHDELPPNIESR